MKCVRCKKRDIYVAPNGHKSIKCAVCLLDDFKTLGLFESDDEKLDVYGEIRHDEDSCSNNGKEQG